MMSRAVKIWLIVAAALIVAGGLIFAAVMSALGWDFTALSTTAFVRNEHILTEDFDSISIDVDTADIDFVLSEDGRCRVECFEREDTVHSVSVKDGVLVIALDGELEWYENIGINFKEQKIRVYLPRAEYSSLKAKTSTADITVPRGFDFGEVDISVTTGDIEYGASSAGRVKIYTTTGDIEISRAEVGSLELSTTTGEIDLSDVTSAGNVNLSVTTGDIEAERVTCRDLISSGSTGDIELSGVIAQGKMTLDRSTGDVKLSRCDASEIFIKTDTGDVFGSLLSEKVFVAHTDTGRCEIPSTGSGGRCEINTDTGDIRITLAG